MQRHPLRLRMIGLVVLLLVALPSAQAQSVSPTLVSQFAAEQDEARAIFNEGLRMFEQGRWERAEQKFREVLRRFPDNAITDRSSYYHIRTLVRMSQATQALSEIGLFPMRFPDSRWLSDVLEERFRLTNNLPRAMAFQAPSAPPVPPAAQAPPVPPAPPAPPRPFEFADLEEVIEQSMEGMEERMREAREGFRVAERVLRGMQGVVAGGQEVDPETSLQQEILRSLFRNDPDRALAVAAERLEANPSDPVVMANFHMIAREDSEASLEMLTNLAKNSPDDRIRKEAIFWISRWDGDEDRVVDVLLDILPTIDDDETASSVAFSLSRVDTESAVQALLTIANDTSRNVELRKNAIFYIGRTDVGNQVDALRQIYSNASDSEEIRKQVAFAVSRIDEDDEGGAGAVALMGEIARNDPSIEVKKQAVFWLGRMDSPEALQILEDLLRGPQ